MYEDEIRDFSTELWLNNLLNNLIVKWLNFNSFQNASKSYQDFVYGVLVESGGEKPIGNGKKGETSLPNFNFKEWDNPLQPLTTHNWYYLKFLSFNFN